MTDGLVPVPTVAELHKMGLAEQIVTESRNKSGKITKSISHRPNAEGQRMMYDAMRHNGKYLASHDEERKALEAEAVHRARQSVD